MQANGPRVVDAAKSAGVRLIVFNTSAYVADQEVGLSAHDGRVSIEAAIRVSGIWYNAQPVSPLAVDMRPVLQWLPIRPTAFAGWARRQDWTA